MPASATGLPHLLQPHFRDEAAALARLERVVWPGGPVCPHCGATRRVSPVTGRSARPALRSCGDCRRQFRATIGTVFEGSHVPLHKWLQACVLLSAGPGRVNAHQLHLHLEVAYKTAVSMRRRLDRIAEVAAMIGVANPLDSVGSHPEPGPATNPPAAWGSQFRDFVRLARSLGCNAEDAIVDRLLACLLLPAGRSGAGTATAACGHRPRRRQRR